VRSGGQYGCDTAGGTLDVAANGGLEILREDAESVRLLATGPAPLTLTFSLAEDELLAGLGECFGLVQQRGRRWRGRIVDLLHGDPQDTYFHLPLVYSSHGYAVLLDTHLAPLWDLGCGDARTWSVSIPATSVEVELFRGTPLRCLELATAVTGRPPLPPPWALGVWKTTLGGTERVLQHADRLRAHRVPVTACWVYDHYDEPRNGGCGSAGTYPTGPYPDFGALTGGLHDLGYRALGYVQPGIYHDSQPYHEAARRGFLVRDAEGTPCVVPYFNPKTHGDVLGSFDDGASPVDFTNPEAASWYQQLLAETISQGWDGWMQDMGEHVPPQARLADGSTGDENRNRYPLLYHRAAAETFARRAGDFTVFARSGALGSVPYVTAMWPGDQHCTWDAERGLGSVIPAGPTAGLAGVATWGPDISGLADGFDASGGRDEELWLRWCEYGALTPIMRDHLGFKVRAGTPVDLWSSDRTVDTFRRHADLHLRLAPYLWRLAETAHRTGVPPIRALLLDFPEHRESWQIADQYLLGPDLLVAPVHQPGARERSMWFPPGEWVGWWDGRRITGPAWLTVPGPLGRIPLYQRAGTSIPLATQADRRLDALDGAAVEHHTA